MKQLLLILITIFSIQEVLTAQDDVVVDPNKKPKSGTPVKQQNTPPKTPKPIEEEINADKWHAFKFQGNWGFKDETEKVVIDPIIDADIVFPFVNNIACVRKGVKYSIINTSGKTISTLPTGYSPVEWPVIYVEGFMVIASESGSCNLIDRSGKLISLTGFQFAENFSNGLAVVKEGGSYYYINKTGKKTLGPFADAKRFGSGLAPVKKHGADKWVYVNSTGTVKIYEEFSDAGYFANGLAPVQRVEGAGKWSYITEDGKIKSTITYKHASSFIGPLAIVQKDNGAYSMLDQTLQEYRAYIYPYESEYHFCTALSNRMFLIETTKGSHYLVDSLGNLTMSNTYVDCRGYNGYYNAGKKANGKWNFLDYSGQNPFPNLEFDEIDIWGFVNGYAKVKRNGMWGVIDIAGNTVVNFEHAKIENLPPLY